MNHHDAEISDVVVVLDEEGQNTAETIIGRLKELGMEVASINCDEGVIEGSIDAGRVNEIKTVPGVAYVRSVFTYTADYPCGDPRDKDGLEAECESDED